MSQKIRIKLKSYDHNLVDKSAEKIVRTVKATGAIVSGPIPLPTHKRIFTVNRSTFVNKKSREQFELSSYKRLIDIYTACWRRRREGKPQNAGFVHNFPFFIDMGYDILGN